MFFGPHLLEADDGRCRQTWRVADEGRQHFLEVAGRDSLQVEDRDQHLKALRSPRISRQDRGRVSDALAIARYTVAHPRLANRDKADAGHDLALWKMAMAYHALMARLGLEVRILCEKLSNLRLDRLGQQRTRAAAQDLCQGVGEDPWLGELDDVTVGHGVSLLHWRSGGVEHHHDTPPYPVSPSPTSGHSSGKCKRVRCGRDRTDRARGEGGQRARDLDRMVPQPEVRSDADWARSRTAVAVAVCRHAGCGVGRRVARDPARPGRIQGNADQDRSKGCAWHRPADAARLVPCGALQIAPSAGSPSAAGSPQAAADQEP